ncbi:MAG TPA: NAD(P)H-dependent oxidoreductase [Terriglobales bacterium]|nr:NAD(P)H-dependent oxidoreductase [Terriglobales bacterium]
MKLLQIDSSARRSSVSRELTAKFVEEWKKENPGGEVVIRDLTKTPLPLITDEWTFAVHSDLSKLTPAQREVLALSDTLIAELFAADIVVIGVPMYNFTIPWTLKAWIDQVVRVGKTFAYGANGPQGLFTGKKIVIITSRAGAYAAGSPRASMDFQEPYLRHILGFIGATDVTFIHAENQRPGGELAAPSKSAALEQIHQLAAQ